MTSRMVAGAIMVALLLSAGMVLGEDESNEWRGRVGYFTPTSSRLDGGITFGVERLMPGEEAGIERSIQLDLAQCSSTREGITGNANALYLLYTQRKLQPTGLFYGAGVGFSRLTASVLGFSAESTDFAWEVCGGMQEGRQSYELRYVNGAQPGNTGLMLTAGMSF